MDWVKVYKQSRSIATGKALKKLGVAVVIAGTMAISLIFNFGSGCGFILGCLISLVFAWGAYWDYTANPIALKARVKSAVIRNKPRTFIWLKVISAYRIHVNGSREWLQGKKGMHYFVVYKAIAHSLNLDNNNAYWFIALPADLPIDSDTIIEVVSRA